MLLKASLATHLQVTKIKLLTKKLLTMKTFDVLQVFNKYKEAIKSPRINVIEKFGKFMEWLHENCEDTSIESTIKLATIHNTLKVLGRKNFRYNESPEWTKTYNEEFFDLLQKLKEAFKSDENTPLKVFVGRMFNFLGKMNTTMYLYYWSHLYIQALGGMLEEQTRKANQLARVENEEELERYLKNAEQTTSNQNTSKITPTASTEEEIEAFASSFSSVEEVFKSFNERECSDWAECARWCAIHNRALKALEHQGIISKADYLKHMKQLVELRFEKFPLDKNDLMSIVTDTSSSDNPQCKTLNDYASLMCKVYKPDELC